MLEIVLGGEDKTNFLQTRDVKLKHGSNPGAGGILSMFSMFSCELDLTWFAPDTTALTTAHLSVEPEFN